MSHFRWLGRYDVSEALAQVEAHPQLWGVVQTRQSYANSAHQDTETIVLRGPVRWQEAFNSPHSTDYGYALGLTSVLALVKEAIPYGPLGRVMVVKLKPHGKIGEHIDQGAYARCHTRYHVVLKAPVDCQFHCAEEVVCMQSGECWWFDHKLPHSVVNGSTERIHLIADVARGVT